MITPDDVVEFWFGKPGGHPLAQAEHWFRKDPVFDDRVRMRFETAIRAGARGELEDWRRTAKGALAYVVLLDQLSRNAFRDTPEMFAQDHLALHASLEAQDRGMDRELDPVQRWFLYMPMMHAEDPAIQERSVAAYERLMGEAPDDLRDAFVQAHEYAVRHRDIVKRFGRYPHRNAILGRESTDEEERFLGQSGSAF